ncbi:lysozyme [Asbolus verrucosus]|uniref:lysozyme n=1 Tax=Asbolus verrucosus TaxID=1661398 RepID=A0A482VLU6_ASBVE|nr:lysozyme [Asbolus verrucosus]
MAVTFVLLLVITFAVVDSKVYDRCELARELKHVHEFPSQQIPTWVCIAKHESTFNTSAINPGSGDHGLFQISDLFWCSPPGNGFACNAPCSAFEDDDITDDIACIRRIFKEHTFLSGNGFNAWTVYPLYCAGDVSKYVEGCFDNDIDNNISQGTIQQPHSTTSEPDDEESVYEFPPLPTPPKKIKSNAVEQSNKPSSFQPVTTTRKPFKLRLQNQISTAEKILKTTSKPFEISHNIIEKYFATLFYFIEYLRY